MSSSIRLVTSSQEQPESGGSLPRAEIIPYPGAHPAAVEKKAKFDFSPLPERLRGIAMTILPTILMLFALLMVWEIACSGEDASLPSPSKVWTESYEVIMHPLKGVEVDGLGFKIQDGGDVGIAGHILTSLKRVAVGFSLSALFGIALGILIGQSKFAYRALDPLFQILRTVPPLAWLPISLAIFQQAQPSAIFLIFITAIWPVILNTAAGVQNIPAAYRNVGKVLALNPFEYFIKIMLPATVPHMFTGLRIGVGMSWLAIVASEMLLGGVGVGFFIWDQYNASRISDIIVALVWVGLTGFVLDRAVAFLGALVSRGTSKG